MPQRFISGLVDDLPLNEWLEEHIWSAENKRSSPGICIRRQQSLHALMLKAGITTCNDMYFLRMPRPYLRKNRHEGCSRRGNS